MNKLLIPVALAVALSAVPFVSLAASGQAFVDLGAGRANYNRSGLSSHMADAFDLEGGYRWDLSDKFALGGEAGYMRAGRARGTSNRSVGGANPATVTGPGPIIGAAMPPTTTTTRSKLRIDGPMIGANGRLAFSNNFFAITELGAYRARSNRVSTTTVESGMISNTVGANVTRRTRNTHQIEAFAGVGMGYTLSPNMDVSLKVDRFEAGRKDGGGMTLAMVDVGVHF